jgi:hypothetical protein
MAERSNRSGHERVWRSVATSAAMAGDQSIEL